MNLTYNKDITLKEALCGFSFELPFFKNKKYKISNEVGNIVKPGYIKEICGMGIKRNNQIGRLFIKFNIIFPEDLSEEKIEELNSIL